MLKLTDEARLMYNKSSGNYYLFCIQTGKHFRLNEISYNILKQLEQGKKQDEITEWIAGHYETDISTCNKDLDELLAFLELHELIIHE